MVRRKKNIVGLLRVIETSLSTPTTDKNSFERFSKQIGKIINVYQQFCWLMQVLILKLYIKRHGGWKSTNLVENYVENLLTEKSID